MCVLSIVADFTTNQIGTNKPFTAKLVTRTIGDQQQVGMENKKLRKGMDSSGHSGGKSTNQIGCGRFVEYNDQRGRGGLWTFWANWWCISA